MIWLWPGDTKESERLYLGVYMNYINDYFCVYQYDCMLILLSSPYLLVFSDDRVCGTRKHRMLMQVMLVMLRLEAGIAWESFYLLCFGNKIVNSHETFWLLFQFYKL